MCRATVVLFSGGSRVATKGTVTLFGVWTPYDGVARLFDLLRRQSDFPDGRTYVVGVAGSYVVGANGPLCFGLDEAEAIAWRAIVRRYRDGNKDDFAMERYDVILS